jgi:hypothetical protein
MPALGEIVAAHALQRLFRLVDFAADVLRIEIDRASVVEERQRGHRPERFRAGSAADAV